ncbi:putative bifunctional diguanylate cyclase/phosphodiesterase [Pontitalea aquivivens]|uniref:putative bifunctional diguanylate cyclase/phosphodiesterase n=1 Tax=Pontitalea aquivivens TaxID=3388663 RepID=UPI00397084AD
MLAFVAAATLGLYWATTTSDQVSTQRQAKVAQLALNTSAEQLAYEQQSIASWDELAAQLQRIPLNTEWLDSHVGTRVNHLFGHDLTFILNDRDQVIYGFPAGSSSAALYGMIEDDLKPLIESVRAQLAVLETGEAEETNLVGPVTRMRPETIYDDHATEVLDRPAAASVMALRPPSGDQEPPLLVSVRYLDGAYLNQIAAWGLLEGLRFSTDPTASPREARVTLRDERGKQIGHFFWKPELPGTRILTLLAPSAALLILISAAVMAFLVWTLWRSGRQLSTAIIDLRASEAQAQHLAFHDVLTGLPNRALYHERLDQAVQQAVNGHCCAILALDLDRFKQVNDALGHSAGDMLIQGFASRLDSIARDSDTVARIGGDEFSILLSNVADRNEVETFCEQVLAMVREPFELLGNQVFVGVSIGVAIAPEVGTERGDLIRKADIALYRAKSEGRERYRFFTSSMDETVKLRKELERDLRRALTNNAELVVHYQPEVDAYTQAVVGLEALVRWKHPKRGLLLPGEFIPVAEETRLISRLSEWVLGEACRAATQWPSLFIAVNLSASQFRSPDLAHKIIGIAERMHCDPRQIELEITENVLLQQDEIARTVLSQLREAGFRIALDDFGTGYSSLAYLREFKFDKIKIDRSFIKNLGQDPEAAAIVTSVVTMGQAMGLTVTAEGVENSDQMVLLSEAGCNELQGFLFSRALPPNEISEVLDGRANLSEVA